MPPREPYQGLLRKYSIDAAGLPWESDDDTAAFISNLRNGTYKARALGCACARRPAPGRCAPPHAQRSPALVSAAPAVAERPRRRCATPPPQALVLDAPVISYLVSTMNDACDLYKARVQPSGLACIRSLQAAAHTARLGVCSATPPWSAARGARRAHARRQHRAARRAPLLAAGGRAL